MYVVIIAGSVVRATGSGMGCPDWPKCFGHWIPPTHVSQLPADYQKFFKVQEQATEPFNALKTWTEYGNRLVGALLGLIMFVQLFFAFRIRKTNPQFLRLALATLFLTGMEGVLGAFVVYNNLKAGVVTVHMFLSLIILVTQAFLVFRAQVEMWTSQPATTALVGTSSTLVGTSSMMVGTSSTMAGTSSTMIGTSSTLVGTSSTLVGTSSSQPEQPKPFVKPALKNLILISFLLTTAQILLGTQVRESVDALMKNFDEYTKGHILDNVGIRFSAHASFALLVTLLNLVLIFLIVKNKGLYAAVKTQTIGIGCVLIAEMIAGTALKLFALPAVLQPVHLLLAALLFGLQWGLILRTRPQS